NVKYGDIGRPFANGCQGRRAVAANGDNFQIGIRPQYVYHAVEEDGMVVCHHNGNGTMICHGIGNRIVSSAPLGELETVSDPPSAQTRSCNDATPILAVTRC